MIKNISLLFCQSILPISSLAATVLSNITTITFSASGSTNNVVGSWSSNSDLISLFEFTRRET